MPYMTQKHALMESSPVSCLTRCVAVDLVGKRTNSIGQHGRYEVWEQNPEVCQEERRRRDAQCVAGGTPLRL